MANRHELLTELRLGDRVAENEAQDLASYFVETDEWRSIFTGEVDVVYGPKGSGKSAIYATLLSRKDDLFDRGILIDYAEEPQGSLAFEALVEDPPTSEQEFVGIWKLYFLALVARTLLDYDIRNEAADALQAHLADAGVLPKKDKRLRSVLKAVHDAVRRILNVDSVEPIVHVNPSTGEVTGFATRITFGEPAADEVKEGTASLEDLLSLADRAIAESGYELWLILDRLDVAFNQSPELEKNALRALFRFYLSLAPYKKLSLKVFLRSDIWARITEEGFTEASHVTKSLTIDWGETSLLNLTVKRLLHSESIRAAYEVEREGLTTNDARKSFFFRIFPKQIDVGPKNPDTFGWILSRTRDGTGRNAPRELIHLLAEARTLQLQALEIDTDVNDEALLTRASVRAALPRVSKVRLEQTLYAEYPYLKARLEQLEGEKTLQTPDTLAAIWNIPPDEAAESAELLVEIGFFEKQGKKLNPQYWVPFLYRPALSMIQGSAE